MLSIKNSKKKEKRDLSKLKDIDKMKYEIAKELGLIDKVLKDGWGSLSARDTGRIGGIMTRRKNLSKKEALKSHEKEDASDI